LAAWGSVFVSGIPWKYLWKYPGNYPGIYIFRDISRGIPEDFPEHGRVSVCRT
jgi:hypothetical protein